MLASSDNGNEERQIDRPEKKYGADNRSCGVGQSPLAGDYSSR